MHFSFDRHSGLSIAVSAPVLVRLAQAGIGLAGWSRRLRIPTPILVFNLIVAPACQIVLIALNSV